GAAWKVTARLSRGWARREPRRSVRPDQVERIDGDPAIRTEPVQVCFRHSPARAYAADRLGDVDRITRHDQHAAEVKIAGHEPGPVVDEAGGPTVVEIGDERDVAALRRARRRA